ncbi:patatin-like phospholipase family protein [Halobacillus sp. ACCC02827]|uniref:patatin-like phospholipase family protein n=1 Tax=Bacillaceae TaxID=186817 RepID=UPI0002A4D037|nr:MULTISPECIES: patatin-like phospholipase family protein [Bacillaceae]ELK46246.1 NTE family protein [Halobacillus sp. BAB-2008]QHT47137.1 patatin-like phospholipase family protein [Bacillus sp. SB49]WJE14364.1 patatin-like phospholipase family protein [Halobacillus sp. ACCC02827]
MKVDGVFSGGGIKALAFIGALEELEEQGYKFRRLAGTSAGAILASLTAAGFTSTEIRQRVEKLSFEQLVDVSITDRLFPFLKWLLLYFRMGLYKGNKLEALLSEWLEEKGIRTFADLPEGSLKVICSDLTLGRIVVLPDDLKKVYGIDPATFSVAKAVRMSSGLPYFFIPVKIHGKRGKSFIIDGGVLSNFPLWIWEKADGCRTRPIIGMKLSDEPDKLPEQQISNAIQMFHALFKTMQQAHDARYISKTMSKDVIFIPVNDVETTDFHLSDAEKEALIELGHVHARKFLKRWSR